MNDIYENKRRFVEKLREALIMVDRFDIADIVYSRMNSKEIIEVTYNSGYTKKLNVTGDSEYAIIIDISRVLG